MLKLTTLLLLTSNLNSLNNDDYVKYIDSTHSFKIEYPSNWSIDSWPGYAFLISEPDVGTISVLGTFVIELKKSDVSLEDALLEYLEILKKNEMFVDVQITEKKNYKFPNKISIHGSAFVAGFQIHWVREFIRHDEFIYSLTFCCEAKYFDSYQAIRNKLFNSFRFL